MILRSFSSLHKSQEQKLAHDLGMKVNGHKLNDDQVNWIMEKKKNIIRIDFMGTNYILIWLT